MYMGAKKGQEGTGTWVIVATEFKFAVRSYLGFKKPDSDFKYIRPNFLSEIITLARESKGPLPSCSRTYWWKVLAGFGTRSATPNKIYNSCGRIEASRSFLRAAKWHKPHTSEIQMRMKKAYR